MDYATEVVVCLFSAVTLDLGIIAVSKPANEHLIFGSIKHNMNFRYLPFFVKWNEMFCRKSMQRYKIPNYVLDIVLLYQYCTFSALDYEVTQPIVIWMNKDKIKQKDSSQQVLKCCWV